MIRCNAKAIAQPKVSISPYCKPSPLGFNKKYIPIVAKILAIQILVETLASCNTIRIIGTMMIEVPVIKADFVGVV